MVNFENSKDIENWLKGQPVDVSVAIAARVALRALPALNSAAQTEEFPTVILLPVLRAITIPAFAGTWPKAGMEVVRRAAAYAADAAADATRGAAYAAAYAADAAADATRGADAAAYAAAYAADAAADATRGADAATRAAYAAAVAADAEFLTEAPDEPIETRLKRLMMLPLWHDDTPKNISENWERLKASLPSDENWWVWTDWYEARLTGWKYPAQLLIFELEKERISIPGEDWEHRDNPAHVNGIIAALEEKYRLPDQDDPAFNDAGEALSELEQDKSVDSVEVVDDHFEFRPPTHPDDQAAAYDAIAIQLHAVAKRQLSEMSEEIYALHNRPDLRGIGGTYDRLCNAISEDTAGFSDQIATFWAELCELGTYLEADDEKKYTPPIEPSARRKMSALMKSAAPLVRHFPTGLVLDEAVKAYQTPAERFGAAVALLGVTESTGLLKQDDVLVLKNFIEAAKRGDYQGLKLKNTTTGRLKNVAIAALTHIASFYVGATASVAGPHSVVANSMAETIIEAETHVLELLADYPADIRIAARELIDDLKRNQRKNGEYFPAQKFNYRREDEDSE